MFDCQSRILHFVIWLLFLLVSFLECGSKCRAVNKAEIRIALWLLGLWFTSVCTFFIHTEKKKKRKEKKIQKIVGTQFHSIRENYLENSELKKKQKKAQFSFCGGREAFHLCFLHGGAHGLFWNATKAAKFLLNFQVHFALYGRGNYVFTAQRVTRYRSSRSLAVANGFQNFAFGLGGKPISFSVFR